MSKSIAVNSFYNFTLKVFRLIVPVLIGPYLLRLFDPTLYGYFNDAATWLDVGLIFGIFGIYTYGIRELSVARDDKDRQKKLYSSLFLIGVVTNLLSLMAYSLVVWFAIDDAARLIYLLLGGKIFANLFMVEWLNESIENYRFITVKTILVRTVYVIAIFSLIKNPDDVLKYTLIVVLTDLVNNLISFVFVTKKIGFTLKGLEITRHIRPLFSILLISNVNLLYCQFDKMLLGRAVSEIAVTVYKIPQDITMMIGNLLASIVLVAVPRLAYYDHNGHPEEFNILVNKSYRSFMLVVFPACMGIACLAKEIMWIYGGGRYDVSIPVLMIFAFRTMESSVYTICANQVLYVKHQEGFLVRVLLMSGMMNIVLDFILLWAGVLTPVTAILATFFAEVILMALIFKKIRDLGVDFTFFNRTNVKYFLISAFFFPIAFLVRSFGWGEIINTLVIMTLCIGFYFSVLLLTKDETMLFLSGKVLQKLKR